MEVTVHGRGVEVTPEVREYVERRLRPLDRHLAHNASTVVEISRSGARSASDRMAVQVTITSNGRLLRTEQHAAEPQTAIDLAVEVLDRQVERVKGRSARRGRASFAKSVEPAEAAVPEPAEREPGDLVKVKQFQLQPQTVEEATEQLELLGHDFYVFLNSESSRINVVYRRHDGDYGLLDPRTS